MAHISFWPMLMTIYWEKTQIRYRISLDTSKEVRLEVNTEKTKYMLMSHYQTAEQQHSIKIKLALVV
jgi:hypothetical protein